MIKHCTLHHVVMRIPVYAKHVHIEARKVKVRRQQRNHPLSAPVIEMHKNNGDF